jgi:hypothetical protein
MFHNLSVTPAAIAGLHRKRPVDAAEVVGHEVQRHGMVVWFSAFFEKALVSRVKRRMCIRIVRF